MEGKCRESDSILDEMLKLSESKGGVCASLPSSPRNLKVEQAEASVKTVRGRVYWFLRWCIDWIEPSSY